MTFGETLKRLRQRKNISQDEKNILTIKNIYSRVHLVADDGSLAQLVRAGRS